MDERELFHRALRQADQTFMEERDRRYTEVGDERAKALKIKEEADEKALVLRAETQTYKDEKANNLRDQIGAERGNYATKSDLAALADKVGVQLAPVTGYVTNQQGADRQQEREWERRSGAQRNQFAAAALLLGVVTFAAGYLITRPTTPVAPTPVQVTVVVPTPTPTR